MKQRLARLLLAAALLLLATAASAATTRRAWVGFDEGLSARRPSDGVQLATSGAPDVDIRLAVDLAGVFVEELETEWGPFSRVDITGGAGTGLPGAPRLPVLRRRVAVPWGGAVTARAHRSDPVTFPLTSPLIPAQPGRRKCDPPEPLAITPKAYEVLHGEDRAVEIVSEGILRGVRHALVEIAPAVYDPLAGTLTVYRRVEVDLRVDAPDHARTRAELVERLPGMRKTVEAQIMGLEMLAGLPSKSGPAGVKNPAPALPLHYVLVVPDHAEPGFEPVLGPLIAWKERKGFVVTVLRTSAVGTTREAVRTALKSLYWEPLEDRGPPVYVVLVGDVQYLPSWERASASSGWPWSDAGPGQSAADMYYAAMDSPNADYAADQIPDFHLGRFSVATPAELAEVVRKTLAYELPADPTADWYRRSLWVASDDMSAMARHTHEWVAPAFLTEGMELTNAFIDVLGASAALRVTESALTIGQNIVNYSGHGSHNAWECVPIRANFVHGLADTGAYPFVITNACQSGQFHLNEQGDCFSETWIKATGGAVAAWAASANSLWNEDDLLEKAVWAAFLPTLRQRDDDPHMAGYPWPGDERYTSIGAVTDMGLMVFEERADRSWSVEYTVEIYNLLGDPSVDLWTDRPRAVDLTTPPVVLLGQSELEITVRAEGAPVAGALVAIHKDDNLRRTARTGEDGVVLVSLDGLTSPGALDLVITGHNLDPLITELLVVAPEGAYVALTGREWWDDGSFESLGNGNRLPSPGETLAFTAVAENFGTETATEVTFTLATADPCVRITRATTAVPALAPGATAPLPEPFLVEVLDCGNNHPVEFTIAIVAAEGAWQETLRFTVGYAVAGDVWVARTEAPLEAQVRWSGATIGVIPRAENGRFVIQGLTPGDYEITVEHPDYLSERLPVTVPQPLDERLAFALGRPEKVVSPLQVNVTLSPGEPAVELPLSIANTGDRTLEFEIATAYSHGDDDFGYRYADTEEDGLPFAWVELPPAQRNVIALGDDEDQQISLPWPFPFYGRDETSLFIGSNGYANFGSSRPRAPRDGMTLPDSVHPRGLLAVLYIDLDPSAGGEVYWGTTRRNELVITWDDVPEYQFGGGGPRHTVQIVLSPTGEIRYNYLVGQTRALIGLQSLGATSGMTVRRASAAGVSVAIATSVRWLEALPVVGTVPPDGVAEPRLQVSAESLGPGTYETLVRVLSNDPREPVTTVRVELFVGEEVDTDGDGIPDHLDNCPTVYNPDQLDSNDNGVGDACEVDCDAERCDDGNLCTDDHCDPRDGCVFVPNSAPCDDGDRCTEDDRCADGECRGTPVVCDDGNPCTDGVCTAARGCVYAPNSDPCDDGDPCTTEGLCVDGGCVSDPVVCDDDDPCTDAACVAGVCVVVTEQPDCCVADDECDGQGAVCLLETHRCATLACAPCDADNPCGHDEFACVTLASGSYCARECDTDEDCDETERCLTDGLPEPGRCIPSAGDCECLPESEQGCDEGALVWFDSCGEPGEVVDPCDGRGCAEATCCPAGTFEEDGRCAPAEDTDTLGGDTLPPSDTGGTSSTGGGCATGSSAPPWTFLFLLLGLLTVPVSLRFVSRLSPRMCRRR